MSRAAEGLKDVLSGDRAPIWILAFVLLVLGVAYASGRWDVAVYALSFWIYLVYVMAFFWRRIPQQRFIRDSILLKVISLLAFAFAFIQTHPSLLSLIVMATGFALNIMAARALGIERTYYGVEVGGMPPVRVIGFPFSLVRHPMLTGSMIAFGAALLAPEFRAVWWPLALLHVILNFAVLQMEIHGRRSRTLGMAVSIIGLLAGALLLIAGFFDAWRAALATIVIGAIFAGFLLIRYAGPDLRTSVARGS
ncbi:methyltransferase [Nitratireductor sp. XY-223]|uniref:methyltransferase n=1 Tax=Nitratireductor sp. XY-223 TaxID=2561926 RepID=UPI00145A3A64|nr:methyltransferase [Nitratireductor sp. XY-223]